MRKLFLVLAFCCITMPCLALVPLTDQHLAAAVNYGISSRQDGLSLERFLEPWLIKEKLRKNPFRQQENLVIYSPYLLAAIHARDKVEAREMPRLEDIRAAVEEYEGILLVGAVLNTPASMKKEDFTVQLVQKKNLVSPYAVTLLNSDTVTARRTDRAGGIRGLFGKGKKQKEDPAQVYRLRLQFYFDETGFRSGERYSIWVSDAQCGERCFDITPDSFK